MRTADGISIAWRGGNMVADRQRTKAIENKRKIREKSMLMGNSHALEILGKCNKYNKYIQLVCKPRERGAVTSQSDQTS
jgi:hypothetical protein